MPPFHNRSTGAFRQALINSAGASASTDLSMPSAARICGVIGIDFRVRGKMPPPFGDQRGVVVGPARAGQREDPGPLLPAAGRIRVRIDEHMPMVERGDQLNVLAEQHSVAEDVAAHVADADTGEVGGLAVDAAFPEVSAYRFPRSAGRDAHALVVIAGGASGGEGIAEPEARIDRDLVGDVGEGGGALVGRDDQIGIIAVVAHHAGRRHHLPVDDVVGDVQQAGDEQLVAGHSLGQPGVAVNARGRAVACRRSRLWRRPARSRCS